MKKSFCVGSNGGQTWPFHSVATFHPCWHRILTKVRPYTLVTFLPSILDSVFASPTDLVKSSEPEQEMVHEKKEKKEEEEERREGRRGKGMQLVNKLMSISKLHQRQRRREIDTIWGTSSKKEETENQMISSLFSNGILTITTSNYHQVLPDRSNGQ